ncbi:UNVERIFIED_CONTAM: hypothetical protein K2H54_048946 [Gekko kuhli]
MPKMVSFSSCHHGIHSVKHTSALDLFLFILTNGFPQLISCVHFCYYHFCIDGAHVYFSVPNLSPLCFANFMSVFLQFFQVVILLKLFTKTVSYFAFGPASWFL